MLRAFFSQEVAALTRTARLWCRRVFSALAFPPLISSGFIPLHPFLLEASGYARCARAGMHPGELGFGVLRAPAGQG